MTSIVIATHFFPFSAFSLNRRAHHRTALFAPYTHSAIVRHARHPLFTLYPKYNFFASYNLQLAHAPGNSLRRAE